MKYVQNVSPKCAIPVHEIPLSEMGKGIHLNLLNLHTDVQIHELQGGESFTL